MKTDDPDKGNPTTVAVAADAAAAAAAARVSTVHLERISN